MDAFSLFTKFLREMSLGILFALAAILLAVAAPFMCVARFAWKSLDRQKGERYDRLYGR